MCLAQISHSKPENVADPIFTTPCLPRFTTPKADNVPDLFRFLLVII